MRNIYIYLLSVFIFFTSCNNENQVDLINKDTLVNILTDIHIANGIIMAKGFQSKFKQKKNKTIPYNSIFKKYSIDRYEFEKTVRYYSERNDEYKDIYQKVISNIEQISEDKDKPEIKKKKVKLKNDIWIGATEKHLPKEGKKDPISYKIKASNPGIYVLSADIRIFPDDKSINLRMTIIANYSDGTKDVNSYRAFKKNTRYNNSSISIITDKKKTLKSISGWVLDHSSGTKKKHIDVQNIKLLYLKF